ncbi:ribonuclease I [Acinetobacter larvae]|uniref:Ribonuclease I n=2 Tax=Acinetobacter larvae TaxID=1789224 RepID=A0A1B2M487_9GAMM|nr:ribonuclease I [Acinetobacter larvae]
MLCAVTGLYFIFNTPCAAASNELRGYVLQIQMTPAVCALDGARQKQRKCFQGYTLNINGLFPDTTRPNCATTSSAALSPLQATVVARVMPDEQARTSLWHNYGGCVPYNASQYFRTMTNLADKLNIPSTLTNYEDKTVELDSLRGQFTRLNPGLPSNGIQFSCQNDAKRRTFLTEINVCYQVNGRYKSCATRVQGNCPSSFMVKGTY